MCWQWARPSCAVAVVAQGKCHGQVQGSGSVQPSSTVSTGTLADLPRETNTAILAMVEKQALCQLLLFHREPDSPKNVFVLGFIFCSRIGCNTGAHILSHSQHREPVSTPSVCPMPRQARAGPRGQAAHVPPHRHAGNSPEPSGPRSVRGRTGREPRGTINSSTPSPPPCAHWHHTLAFMGHTQLGVLPGTGFAPSRMQVQAGIQAFLLRSPLQHSPSQLPPLQHRIPLWAVRWQGTQSQSSWCPTDLQALTR